MVEIRRLLCPVDFSDVSRHALDHAAAIAGWYDATVTALHVWHPGLYPPPSAFAGPYLNPVQGGDLDARLHAELAEFVKAANPPLVDPELWVAEGPVADTIVARAAARKADLIVVGTHGTSGFERLVLGSVTEKVLRKAACPVLTVPPRARATSKLPFRRLLCPVDFSESSLAALQFAFSMAQESDAQLTILHVLEEWPSPDQLKDEPERSKYSHQRDETAKHLDSLVPATIRDWCLPLTRLGHGKAYREILGVATEDEMDLIVMGVHGRNAFDMMLFGSTTNQVVRFATCPVLTVRCG